MEKERSKSVQETYKQSRNTFETRDMTAKRSKKHIVQDTAPQTTFTENSSAFLGAVNRHYPRRKQSLLKRLSECSLSPCSEEYTFVMQGFKGTESESKSTVHVSTPRRARNRKISFNNLDQGSKYSATRPTSGLKSALTFQPRLRGNTLPSRISDVRIPAEPGAGNTNLTPAAHKHVLDVKVAWQGVNDDLNSSVKRERKRHVSLSDLPQKQLSSNKHEEKSERKLSETFRNEFLSGRGDKSGRKIIPQRKKADTDLPKIEEKGFIDNSQIKPKETEICYENQGKSLTADQTDDEKSSINSENFLASYPLRVRSYSSGNLPESNDTTRVKGKLSHSISWEPVFCDRPTTELSLNRGNIGAESKNFETHLAQPPSRRRTSQFAITRANIRRVGKAALVATRLLKIHYRENGGKKVISEEEKELDKLFEEMKDCRYLRKSTSEMKI